VKHLFALALFIPAYIMLAQDTSSDAGSTREVRGQTIVSEELPKAELTFARPFRYVGSQRVNLYGNADAEQYLFVTAGRDAVVKRFYWVQFEHFLAVKLANLRLCARADDDHRWNDFHL
jgi:hypothetical protein